MAAAAIFPGRLVLFLGLFAWHLQAVVDPRCVFFAQNDLFLWNLRFFRDFLPVPGGLAAWLGELVLQACHFGWPGALVLTALAWLVLTATMGFMRHVSSSGAGAMWMAPAIVLLVAHSRYDYLFSASIGAALAMVAAFGYVRAFGRGGKWRVAWFAGLCAVLYYAAGAAFYVFALCVMIYEFYRPARPWTKLGLIVGAIAGRFAVDGVLALGHPGSFYLHIPVAVPFAEERSLSALAVALYASFPLCAALLADRAARREKPGEASPSTVESDLHRPTGLRGRLRWAAVTVLLIAAAALAGKAAARPDIGTVLALHHGADGQRWDEVLRLAARVAPEWYSQYVVHDVNLALYQTGRMPFDMFSYRQFASPYVVESHTGPHALPMIDPDVLCLRRLGEFHFQLGRLNDAEYCVHESFVRRPSSECLRQLTRIAVAKGQVDQARGFLSVLRDDLVYGPWAEDWLRRLEQTPGFSGDAEIESIRALRLAEEDIHLTAKFVANPIVAGRDVSMRKQIASALRQNPRNRMAFEFLMAGYLVDANVVEAVALLPMAANLSYPAMPPLYEEAAMIYARVYKDKLQIADGRVLVNGCAIGEQTLSKIRRLDEATDCGRVEPKELARIAGELGLAYFRYYYHGRWGD